MRIIRSIAIAFSIYSKIPMPVFEWREEDLKDNIVFLPWVGLVIGILCFYAGILFDTFKLPLIVEISVISVIPLLVTGGFHVDGYMDVQDALKSYKSREERLEIMKDPHIGAFAVISLLKYVCLWVIAVSIIICNATKENILLMSMAFFIIRTVLALMANYLKKAKKDGMLYDETKSISKAGIIFLVVQLLCGIGLMIYCAPIKTIIIMTVIMAYILFYKNRCYKAFGGITGDTSGYFITEGELVYMLGLMLAILINI